VTQARFNHNGTKLATGDMLGVVNVWKAHEPDSGQQATTAYSLQCPLNTGADLEWILWHHAADILLAGSVTGHIWMWLVASAATEPTCKVYEPHVPAACTSALMLPDGQRLFVGYANGDRALLHLKTHTATLINLGGVWSPLCSGQVNVVCQQPHQSPVCASAGTDGNIVLVHVDSAKVLSVVPVPVFRSRDIDNVEGQQEVLDSGKSIEAMSFSPDGSVLCVGYVNGTLNFLQSSNLSLRGTSQIDDAAIVKIIPLKQHQIAVSATDGVVRIYDTRSCQIVNELTGHVGEIYDVARIQIDDADFVLSASADGTCKVFEVDLDE